MLKVESHTPVNGVQVDVITGFGASYGIDFDREKNVYIPDFKTGNFIRLSPDLEQQQAFDTNGSALVDSTINQIKSVADAVKALDSPHEVSFDDDGNIYVSDYGAGCVAQISPEGTVLRRLGEELNDGTGIIQPVTTHFARDGFLYVGEYGNARILRYTKEGEMVGWLGATETGPAQSRFRTSGKPVALNTPGGLSYPHATRIDADGFLYVTDTGNNRIVKYDEDGGYIGWVGLRSDGRLNQSWEPDGQAVEGRQLGAFHGPLDIEIDGAGNIYVSDCENDRIVRLDAQGQSIAWLGKPEGGTSEEIWHVDGIAETGTGIMELHGPFGLRLDDDTMYIADKQNFRIQIVRSSKLEVTACG
jgi:DNA-binding beta-propeller fold protein YncE